MCPEYCKHREPEDSDHSAALYSLDTGWVGMQHLYSIVRALETQREPGDNNQLPRIILDLQFDTKCGSGEPLLVNYFFWYATTATAYLDLFKKLYPHSWKPRKECQSLFSWRNKIAAHLSFVSPKPPRNDPDSLATQQASIRQFVTWDDSRYTIGKEVTSHVDTNGTRTLSNDSWGWSLTETHEKIADRCESYMETTTNV